MEISTFKVKVQKAVSEVLGQEYTVELREVQKNNGVLLQGLMIRKGQDNVTPTIYLNSFWVAYEGGVTFADIIKKIISIYKEDGIGRKIDVSFFQDFEKVKEKLCFRLVNREKNREQLEKVPYIPILDLAICFYYAFDEAGVDNGMIPIYRSHLDNWKVTDRDLLEIAVKNTPRLFPGETIPMEDVLERFGHEATLVSVNLETGRTHQIRVHFSSIGHPLCGDPMYGANPVLSEALGLDRQWLHAMKLEFRHPRTRVWTTVRSQYPADLAAALDAMRARHIEPAEPAEYAEVLVD